MRVQRIDRTAAGTGTKMQTVSDRKASPPQPAGADDLQSVGKTTASPAGTIVEKDLPE